MGFKRIFLLFSFIVLMVSCHEQVELDTHIKSYKALKKNFANVPNSFRTVPFWVWNSDVTEAMIDENLADYAEKGFGGVFVHPRYGLITEYASEEWYKLIAYATKKAKKLGLDLWIYDENSFPSGFAGGIVPSEMPSSYNEGHALRMHRQSLLAPDSTKEYVLIYEIGDSLIDITTTFNKNIGKKGSFLLWEKVYYPVSDWYAGFSYVDLLKKGVTEKFIEVTMSGYEQEMKAEFGETVPGIFTDEPNIAPQGGDGLIRWTPDLFAEFYKRWNYRLEPNLNALIENNSMSAKVRHNYYQVLLELFIERWSKPWHEYTENNNLAWTGHYWEHGWPSPHHGPDNMAMYAWHQVPGIDMLFNTWKERPDQFGNIRAVRELNSVANQLGQIRKLSESYGASGWELTFEDMKRNGDWEYVLGVNLLNQHLSYQSLSGERKHDFPQSFSYHAPYWEEYPMLNDYFARLSLALSSGEQVNKTLVLEPTTSAWMHYSALQEKSSIEGIEREFRNLLQILESEQIEYDLGSENIIRNHGSVDGDLFVIGKRKYNFVVIPRFLTNLNSETADLLEKYLKHGGIIIALCQAPPFIDGSESNRTQQWTEDYPEQWFSLGGCNDPRLINYLQTDNIVMTEQLGGTVFHMRRNLDDGQLLFIVNSSKTEWCDTRVIMQGKDMVNMNLFSGRIESYPCVYSNDILSFDVELAPAGSILLYISEVDLKEKMRRLPKWRGVKETLEISEIQTLAKSENVLALDYCSLVLDGDTIENDYFYSQQTRIFNHYGFSKNPWVSASQFRTEIVDRDTFSQGTGFTAIFPFFTDSRFESNDLKIVVEKPHLYKLKLNGTVLEPTKDEWWLDKEFGVYRVKGNLNTGTNYIELKADPMSVFCELEPVYLVGDLNVFALDKGWILARSSERKLGSWKDNGMPFYSGSVEYSSRFDLAKAIPVKLIMKKWKGTVASVTVNGRKAGNIFMEPHELRIDEYVRPGNNEISVTIFGSLKNLLGPHHNIEEHGFVTPWSFKYAPVVQPSGIDYDLLDYGLLEPFEIEAIGN